MLESLVILFVVMDVMTVLVIAVIAAGDTVVENTKINWKS